LKKVVLISIFLITLSLAFALFGVSCKVNEGEEDILTQQSTVKITETTEAKKDTKIKLSFVGDVMLASYKNETYPGNFNDTANKNPPEYFLEKVRPIFEADDFTIVNLENVFTDKDLSAVPKNHNPAYWFRSRTSNTQILTTSSVEGVSLSNNHTNDYGPQGYKDTIAAIESANLQYGTDEKFMFFEKDGFKIAIICTGLWGEWQADNVVKRIKTVEDSTDYQIVFFHGGTERLHAPEEWKVRAAHKIVDAGADLVLGNHPHVLQPREVYNGVEIIYSLGNFCYGGHSAPKNRTIIYQMELIIDDSLNIINSESNIIPCYVYTGDRNNYQPAIIEEEEVKNKVLRFMNNEEELPY
jgi:poly-gamma-glutamate synthesis protein (capsule biosynthesis protein)